MTPDITLLAWTAASIGFLHTITGPDHYLPFIVLGKARNWSIVKTLWITALCGVGHVMGSVALGFIGIGLGIALKQLVDIESVRGDIAAWGLIAFGLAYLVWGLRWGQRKHAHIHTDGTAHVHKHPPEHHHSHANRDQASLTPWVLFIIFVLGPCEPLIPILMIPAAKSSVAGVAYVASIFSIVTILTMMAVVWVASTAAHRLPLGGLTRWSHALAGGALALSGILIVQFGL